jgi:hypothetical protein
MERLPEGYGLAVSDEEHSSGRQGETLEEIMGSTLEVSDEEHSPGRQVETLEEIMGSILEGLRQFPPEQRGALSRAMQDSLELAPSSNVAGLGEVVRDGIAMLQALDTGEVEHQSEDPAARRP